jgi:hypothetical protein
MFDVSLRRVAELQETTSRCVDLSSGVQENKAGTSDVRVRTACFSHSPHPATGLNAFFHSSFKITSSLGSLLHVC